MHIYFCICKQVHILWSVTKYPTVYSEFVYLSYYYGLSFIATYYS